jgi:hypothetical protein
MRLLALAVAGVLMLPAAASAHSPATAIGRAVEALSQVDVSYDPGAAVSDVEAAGFGALAGDGIAVALLPASALSEISGGRQAVVDEIAREAALDGTLVALVGTRLAAVSNDLPPQRLDELVSEASSAPGPPASRLESLTRAVRTEQPDRGGDNEWGWVAGIATAILLVGAVVMRRRIRGQA